LPKRSQPQAARPQKKSRFAAIGDVISELRKVVWPSRRETLRLSAIVAAVCISIGLILGAIDYGFAELMAKVFLAGG